MKKFLFTLIGLLAYLEIFAQLGYLVNAQELCTTPTETDWKRQ